MAVPAPNASSAQTYIDAVRQIRQIRQKGVEFEVEWMLLLLKLEQRPHLWAPTKRFEDVIEKEQLCTLSRWRSFKRAAEGFPRKDIFALGVDAACLIAKQPRGSWIRLLNIARRFRKKHDQEPTYQYITQLLPKKPGVEKVTKKDLLAKIARLEGQLARRDAHIERLEALLRSKRIRVPAMPKIR